MAVPRAEIQKSDKAFTNCADLVDGVTSGNAPTNCADLFDGVTSSTRAPSSNDTPSELSCDSQPVPKLTCSEAKLRIPQTPAEYLDFAAEAIVEVCSQGGSQAELAISVDIARFCAQLAEHSWDDALRRQALVRVANVAFAKGAEMRFVQMAQKTIMHKMKQLRDR
jgi:hypothetical protein